MAAARAIANTLGYTIGKGKLFENLIQFADAIQLPYDGSIPLPMRERIRNYIETPKPVD